jgi:hypothetical protein
MGSSSSFEERTSGGKKGQARQRNQRGFLSLSQSQQMLFFRIAIGVPQRECSTELTRVYMIVKGTWPASKSGEARCHNARWPQMGKAICTNLEVGEQASKVDKDGHGTQVASEKLRHQQPNTRENLYPSTSAS